MHDKYDVLIIGGGPGGYVAAIRAGQLGLRTVLVEKQHLGGICLNWGCIPTKALLHASDMFHMMQSCDEFGVSTDFISFDFGKMQKYKKKAVAEYRSEIEQLFEEAGVDMITGTASIRRGKHVDVRNASGKEHYVADSIIIATGARPALPDIPGIDKRGVWTSDRLLASDTWNFERMTIVGGGVIGVEFATIFNSLCSQVTIIEREDHLLGPMDKEVAQALEKELRAKGIQIYCRADLREITDENGLVCHITQDGKELHLRSGQILVATGRTPYMEDLFGEDVEFQMDQGRLVVDSEFRTSEPGVYAIGDVAADIQLAHVAAAQGTYVVEKIAGKEHTIRLSVVPNGMYARLPVVPNCIYTNPEIATVGLTEEAAKASGLKVRCGKYSMGRNGKSIITGEESGFIRLVFESYSGNLVGAQMVCPRATDMIGEMATAIACGLSDRKLLMAMRAHPTYSEGIKAAIEDAMRA